MRLGRFGLNTLFKKRGCDEAGILILFNLVFLRVEHHINVRSAGYTESILDRSSDLVVAVQVQAQAD